MSIRLALFMFLALFVLGCSKETKEETATVEDHTAAAADTGAEAHGTGADQTGGRSALDDPNSPLAVRVIYFEYDSSDVLPQYRSVVEAHAAYLAGNPNTVITLEGHADERGSREYNLALGERRAYAVKSQMTLLGAGDNQIRTVSYGEERPALEGHDESDWSQNRRVEIRY
ncbi:MAG: peptidoglycan-associated lipoprotein Pal [Gammaproteobacteria bacterium]